jgi:hypothetical protein
MKKSVIFVVLMLIASMALNTIVTAEELGNRDQDDFFYRDTPAEQVIRFLLVLIIVMIIIVYAGIVIAKRGNIENKSKNQNHSFIPPTSPSPLSQYAFIKKSYCSQCGRLINYESKLCLYCGNKLG